MIAKPYAEYTKDELMQLLESLTPGGSEFHQSPMTCVEFIRDRRRVAVAATAKRRNAEKQQGDLLDACVEAEEWLDHHGGYGVGDDDSGLVELLASLRFTIAKVRGEILADDPPHQD